MTAAGHQRQAEPDIGAIARERADRCVRGDGEIGKAQHRVDRGQADRRRGEDRAGHQAVQNQVGRRRSAPSPPRFANATSSNLNAPLSTRLIAELAVGDVADIGERAGPAGTAVLDVLALLQRRQAHPPRYTPSSPSLLVILRTVSRIAVPVASPALAMVSATMLIQSVACASYESGVGDAQPLHRGGIGRRIPRQPRAAR